MKVLVAVGCPERSGGRDPVLVSLLELNWEDGTVGGVVTCDGSPVIHVAWIGDVLGPCSTNSLFSLYCSLPI